MKIEHIAIWVRDLDAMKNFYERFFHATSGDKYVNSGKGFSSYFLSFASGARLELMHKADIAGSADVPNQSIGLAHFSVSVGSEMEVDRFTNAFREAGITIAAEPRTTGDGYYESLICDPEGNVIEITV